MWVVLAYVREFHAGIKYNQTGSTSIETKLHDKGFCWGLWWRNRSYYENTCPNMSYQQWIELDYRSLGSLFLIQLTSISIFCHRLISIIRRNSSSVFPLVKIIEAEEVDRVQDLPATLFQLSDISILATENDTTCLCCFHFLEHKFLRSVYDIFSTCL